MRRIGAFLTGGLLILLMGCYDVNEKIQIQADGSGTYAMNMDMGQLIEMMQNFAGEEELAKEGLDRPIDTTFEMSALQDQAQDISAEKKALYANGSLHMQLDLEKKIFKIDTRVPFKSLADLQQLLADMGGNSGISNVFSNMFNEKQEDDTTPDSPKDPGMSALGNLYTVTAQDGLLSRIMDTVKYNALMADPQMEQLRQMGAMGIEVNYTTTIELPRPVKKADNPLIKLSDDKKTVTFQFNVLDILTDPQKFDYTIEY